MQHCEARERQAKRERRVAHVLKKYPELVKSHDLAGRKGERGARRRSARTRRSVRRAPESALSDAMDEATLFSCPICRNVLKGPVTVECGHTFCSDCLEHTSATCAICSTDVGSSKCVNVLVQDLVEKWRERNKSNSTGPKTVPVDSLGIQPRYQLRSGFVGLQISDENTRIYVTTAETTKQVEDKIFRCCDIISPTDLECILCSRCIFDPTTTACGHTFCRDCLTRVLDHGLSCPLCMACLSVKDYSRGSSIVVDQAIKCLLPKEYNERLQLNLQETRMLNRNSDIPVFVCTNAFPGVACPLYVYEARYRLLVRRCLLSSTRRFAMAAKEDTGEKFVSYGTVLEVNDAVLLEDGSFILTTSGVRRFRVLNRGEQDGYDTARVQFIKDTPVASDKLPELLALHQKVYNKASKWIMSLTPKILAEVKRLIGQMPNVEENWFSLPDGPSWTWWLMPILPLSSQLQVGFLSTTNIEKRLRAIDKMLERMEIRMKALERNTPSCLESEDAIESCSDPERTFQIPLDPN